MAKRKRPKESRKQDGSNGILIYHDMLAQEDFTRCAQRIFEMVRAAQTSRPGARRFLLLRVQGHRNDAGGYDHDSYEIMRHFLMVYMSPYLSEIETPLYHIKNPHNQKNDVPDQLIVQDEKSEFEYNIHTLSVRKRETTPVERASRPSVKSIKEYLGIDEACLICWSKPIERAHVVPESLGGTNDIRNFALLCPRHHRESPDIADAEGFWAWIDYVHDREKGKLSCIAELMGVEQETVDKLRAVGVPGDEGHFTRVKQELIQLYKWTKKDFESIHRWDALMDEYHHVIEQATSTHFAVKKKPSTDAEEAIHRCLGVPHRPETFDHQTRCLELMP